MSMFYYQSMQDSMAEWLRHQSLEAKDPSSNTQCASLFFKLFNGLMKQTLVFSFATMHWCLKFFQDYQLDHCLKQGFQNMKHSKLQLIFLCKWIGVLLRKFCVRVLRREGSRQNLYVRKVYRPYTNCVIFSCSLQILLYTNLPIYSPGAARLI